MFASMYIVVLTETPKRFSRQFEIWQQLCGMERTVLVTPRDLNNNNAHLERATHLVALGEEDGGMALSFAEAVRAALATARSGAVVVNGCWLPDSLAGGVKGATQCRAVAEYVWPPHCVARAPSPPLAVDARWMVLPKYACMRKTTEEGAALNKELVALLAEQSSWWQNGALAEESKEYRLKAKMLDRVIALVKCWDVRLTSENWEEREEERIARQYFVSKTTNSKTGGVLQLIEDLVQNLSAEDVTRPDSVKVWRSDPKRRFINDIQRMKMHVGVAGAAQCFEKGVRTAEELCARRLDPSLRLSAGARANLEFAPVGPSRARMDADETAQIRALFARACGECGLACTFVGSLRRGKVGGHDLDVLVRVAGNDDSLWGIGDYEFSDTASGRGAVLMRALFAKLTAIDVAGSGGVVERFLVPHSTVGLHDDKSPRKTLVRHCFLRSPSVPGAYRQIDIVLTPPQIWAHAMLGWSGSKTIERDLREYIKGAHELRDGVAWGHVPDQKPIVGRRGWDVTPSGARGNLVFGRELHIEQDEHWQWSQTGLSIGRGTHSRNDFVQTYVEDDRHLLEERDIFSFFHLDYLEPRERCA